MRKQDHLHQLIQSLTKAEKKYFSENTSAAGKKKGYYVLYEALQDIPIYDADLLSAKLGKSKANLAHEKEYLQSVLMKNLRGFHSNNPIVSQHHLLAEIQVLREKGQHALAAQQLQKGIADAEKRGQLETLQILLQWQYHVIQHIVPAGDRASIVREEIEVALEKNQTNIQMLQQLEVLDRLISKHLNSVSENVAPEDYRKSNEWLKDKLLNKNFNHPRLRFKQYEIKTMLYSQLRENEEAARMTATMLDIMVQHPAMIFVDARDFTIIVQNHIQNLISCNQLQEAISYLSKIRTPIYDKLPYNQTYLKEVFTSYYYSNILYLYYKLYKNGERNEQEVKQLLIDYKQAHGSFDHLFTVKMLNISIYYKALLEFLIRDYEAFTDTLNKMLSEMNPEIFPTLLQRVYIALAVGYLSQGNFGPAKSSWDSAMRLVKKQRPITSSEKEIQKTITQAKTTPVQQRTELFKQLRLKLDKLRSNSAERDSQQMFDYELWIERNLIAIEKQ